MLTFFDGKTEWLADHAVSDHNNDLLALRVCPQTICHYKRESPVSSQHWLLSPFSAHVMCINATVISQAIVEHVITG